MTSNATYTALATDSSYRANENNDIGHSYSNTTDDHTSSDNEISGTEPPEDGNTSDDNSSLAAKAPSPSHANLIIFLLASMTFCISITSGIITVALPRMAKDLNLPERLYLWPTSVSGLTSGASFLVVGAIADALGPRSVDLAGCFLMGCFTLGSGFAQTGVQFVVFRAFQGVANAMHLPASVSLIAKYVPSGKRRNLGFGCLGLSMPLGFSFGLVIGGALVDTVGWRFGFWATSAPMLLETLVAIKVIPDDNRPPNALQKVANDIDWVGAGISSVCLAMLNYVLAILSVDYNSIKELETIVLLTLSLILVPAFPYWMHRQEKAGKPALVPNYLWKNLSFSSVCMLTLLTWGVTNGIELFSSFYFQEVQQLSALQASIRIVPSLLVGTILNFTVGYFVDRVSPFWLVLSAMLLTAGSPLLMALINPAWSYWCGAFFAQLLAPVSGDVLFTVGLIIVSEIFPEETQALAGAVFNTVAYFGMALGLNTLQVVSLLVSRATKFEDKDSPLALLAGYGASFWTMFAMTIASAAICIIGLRNIGRIGLVKL